MAVDRLSPLHDDILRKILSFIPDTEEKARTSVLSKRFRFLWTYDRNIRLGYQNQSRDRESHVNSYLRSVDPCFASFNSPTLDSLHFYLHAPQSSAESNARWIRFAAIRSVKDLHLSVLPWAEDACSIPESIFYCKNLTHLEIIYCTFDQIPYPSNFQGFRLLTNLSLILSPMSSQTFASLLSGCPLVETLRLHSCFEVTRIEVESERLKHVSVEHCWHLEEVIFDAPNLESIKYYGKMNLLSVKGAKLLRNASVRHFYRQTLIHPDPMTQDDWERCLMEVSHTSETLRVNPWLFKFVLPKSTEPIFRNLRELECCAFERITAPVFCGLISVLEHCPNLEKLKIDVRFMHSITNRKIFDMQDEEESDSNTKELKEGLTPPAEADSSNQEPEEESSPPPANKEKLDSSDEEEVDSWGDIHFKMEYENDQERDSVARLKTVEMIAFLGTANEMKLLEYLLSNANALERVAIADLRMRNIEEINQMLAYIPKASPLVKICKVNVSIAM